MSARLTPQSIHVGDVGWMIGPKDVIKAATNLQSHLSSNVSNVSQRAAIAALTGDLAAVHKMGEAFNRRRKLIALKKNLQYMIFFYK